MSDGLTDQDIVRGLQCGDRDAWSALCLRYSSSLWKLLARLIGGDQEAVADSFQETLLAVAAAGRRLDVEQTRLWGWLATIAHRQAALYWRKHYRDVGNCSTETTVLQSAEGEPVHVLALVETTQRVRLILAEMNAEYAAVLTAKYLDGLSIAEIVELFGGTTESTRSRLARARREFRQRFEGAADES